MKQWSEDKNKDLVEGVNNYEETKQEMDKVNMAEEEEEIIKRTVRLAEEYKVEMEWVDIEEVEEESTREGGCY